MEESKIAMKLEEEMKPLKKMCEKLMDAANHELEKGIESVNAEELGEVVDMIKDIYKAKKEIAETCYYKSVMQAMEEHDFESEEEIMDDGRRGYRGQPRSQSGRFMSRGDGRRSNRGRRGYEEPWDEMYDEMEYMRDMDRSGMGRMYYTGGSSSSGGGSGMSGGSSGGSSGGNMGGMSGGSSGGSRGYSEGSRYENARRGYEEKKQSGADKQEKMKSLEEYMKELSSDVTDMIKDASPEEKSMLKTKMQTLLTKIQ